jgi:Prion-inhibition and propagation/Protein tyrosine and serine/threonine kinase
MRSVSLRYDGMVEKWPEGADKKPRLRPVDTVNLKEYRAIFESKDIPKDKRKYPRGLNRVIELATGGKEILKHPKRFRWAAVDEKKFKEDLARMQQLTNFLHETLGDHQMKILMETTRDTYLAVLQLTKEVRQMKAVAEMAPAPTANESENAEVDSIFSQAETLTDERFPSGENGSTGGAATHGTTIFERLAAFRAINTRLYGTEEVLLSALKLDSDKDLGNLNVTEGAQRVTAIYQGKNVWVEWKSYKPEEVFTDTSVIYRVSERQEKDAERLVALLQAKEKPAEFCVPDCAGYFEDAKHRRFGFVYEIRDPEVSTFKPKSLLQLFGTKTAPLKPRVGLAQRLATCLLYLHATNWLHKALRSASILFFSEEGVVELGRPYISNFEYSRPDKNSATYTGAPETPEWAAYCHPDYLGRPGYFRKTYDIYSLGIILIEIAFWKSAEAIFDVDGEETTSPLKSGQAENGILQSSKDPETESPLTESEKNLAKLRKIQKIRGWLLLDETAGGKPELMEHVRNVMGDKYHNAVKACISGLDYFHLPKEVDQTDPVIATLLQQAYLRLVVDVLHSIIV